MNTLKFTMRNTFGKTIKLFVVLLLGVCAFHARILADEDPDLPDLHLAICSKEVQRFDKKLRSHSISLATYFKIIRKLAIEKCAPDNYALIHYLSRIIVEADRLEKGEITQKEFKNLVNRERRKYARKYKKIS